MSKKGDGEEHGPTDFDEHGLDAIVAGPVGENG
jgi:hypothetical protein